MAHLFRLIVAVLVTLGGSVSAQAEVHYVGIYSNVQSVGSSVRAACEALVVAINEAKVISRPVTFKSAALGRFGCWFDIQRTEAEGGVISDAGDINEVQGPCPGACGSGGNADLQNYCKNIGKDPVPLRVRSSSVNADGQVCEVPFYLVPGIPEGHGCVTNLGSGIKTVDENGVSWTQAMGVATEQTCTGPLAGEATGPDAEPVKDPCPNGYAGTVNGTQVCAQHDPTSGVDWTGTKTRTNPDGSKEVVKTETSCKGGQCTTTTTTTTTSSTGTVTSTSSTTTDGIKGTCASNPANGVCAATGTGNGTGNGGSSFGGDCVAGFKAVSDDAVLNAMAMEQHKRNCEMLRTDSEPSTWLQAEGQKTGDRTGDLPGNNSVSISGADIDMSDALGGGGCNLDKTITVAKMTVTLPFSKVCQPLEVFGQLLVAVSLLLAGRIIMRG